MQIVFQTGVTGWGWGGREGWEEVETVCSGGNFVEIIVIWPGSGQSGGDTLCVIGEWWGRSWDYWQFCRTLSVGRRFVWTPPIPALDIQTFLLHSKCCCICWLQIGLIFYGQLQTSFIHWWWTDWRLCSSSLHGVEQVWYRHWSWCFCLKLLGFFRGNQPYS